MFHVKQNLTQTRYFLGFGAYPRNARRERRGSVSRETSPEWPSTRNTRRERRGSVSRETSPEWPSTRNTRGSGIALLGLPRLLQDAIRESPHEMPRGTQAEPGETVLRPAAGLASAGGVRHDHEPADSQEAHRALGGDRRGSEGSRGDQVESTLQGGKTGRVLCPGHDHGESRRGILHLGHFAQERPPPLHRVEQNDVTSPVIGEHEAGKAPAGAQIEEFLGRTPSDGLPDQVEPTGVGDLPLKVLGA